MATIAVSNVFICDLPVRMDNYDGCSHGCSYCFVRLKRDISQVKGTDISQQLQSFIQGKRVQELKMFDYDIPLHWGGLSDPFQPLERKLRLSEKLLKIFAETQYPFVISTKGIVVFDYIELLKKCNCVIQFSAVCKRYDQYEPEAMPFEKRLEAMKLLSPYKRVVARMQPYQPFVLKDTLGSIEQFADAGIYGIAFEAMKYKKKTPNTLPIGGDYLFPINILKAHFFKLKDKANSLGLKFFGAENRLRQFGDSLCCCGVEGMGWQYHKANLNHHLFDPEGVTLTDGCIHNTKSSTCRQDTKSGMFVKNNSFTSILELAKQDKGLVEQLLPIK